MLRNFLQIIAIVSQPVEDNEWVWNAVDVDEFRPHEVFQRMDETFDDSIFVHSDSENKIFRYDADSPEHWHDYQDDNIGDDLSGQLDSGEWEHSTESDNDSSGLVSGGWYDESGSDDDLSALDELGGQVDLDWTDDTNGGDNDLGGSDELHVASNRWDDRNAVHEIFEDQDDDNDDDNDDEDLDEYEDDMDDYDLASISSPVAPHELIDRISPLQISHLRLARLLLSIGITPSDANVHFARVRFTCFSRIDADLLDFVLAEIKRTFSPPVSVGDALLNLLERGVLLDRWPQAGILQLAMFLRECNESRCERKENVYVVPEETVMTGLASEILLGNAVTTPACRIL